MTGRLAALFCAPDGRSAAQVNRDIEVEFAHHASCLRDEFRLAGAHPDRIDTLVAERFGDARRFAAACRAIALKERIMLQRINLALLVVLILAMAWIVHGTDTAAENNLKAIAKLTERVEALGRPAAAGVPAVAVAADRQAQLIYINGAGAGRPGAYAIPPDQKLTLRQALVSSQCNLEPQANDEPIKVIRLDFPGAGTGNARSSVVFSLTRAQAKTDPAADFELIAGDRIEVP